MGKIRLSRKEALADRAAQAAAPGPVSAAPSEAGVPKAKA
jgi:hypothetical protein